MMMKKMKNGGKFVCSNCLFEFPRPQMIIDMNDIGAVIFCPKCGNADFHKSDEIEDDHKKED